MDHTKILLDAITSGLGISGREIILYEKIILGYEDAERLRYTPIEYLRGLREANIYLFNRFMYTWAFHYEHLPGTPQYKEFHCTLYALGKEGHDYIGLKDFFTIRRSINKAHHKLIGNKQTLNVLANEEIKNENLPFNTELFPSFDACRFFKEIEPEIVKPNRETVGYSFIYRQMVNDGFIFNRVRQSDYIDFISDEYGYTMTKIKTLQEISSNTRDGFLNKYMDRMKLLELIPPNKRKP